MNILVLGAGKMGSWLARSWANDHQVAVFDTDPKKCDSIFDCQVVADLKEVKTIQPDLLVNAVGLRSTLAAFESVMPFLPSDCMLSDIASVKGDLIDFYEASGFPFVSTHPMFGPTFADVNHLADENAVIIKESCDEGKQFFRKFYNSLQLNIFDYSFAEHDQAMAYSLATPFISTLTFASCMKELDVPGTTFKKHLAIAHGLLSEDDELVSEILLNDASLFQAEKIHHRMAHLIEILQSKDRLKMKHFLADLRSNVDFGRG